MNDSLKLIYGKAASRVFHQKKAELATGNVIPQSKLERAIAATLIDDAAKNGDHGFLRSYFSLYWQGSEGEYFYDTFRDRFENCFLGAHYPVIKELKNLIESEEGKFSHLYEIGCGDGQVINHLAGELSEIESFVGIDLNEKIIERNREFYREQANLQFENGDACGLIKKAAKPGSIVMTYGGVMEYFLESELREMFTMLKEKSPVAIVLVEPLYDDFDLSLELNSRPCGREHSFTHNYPHLLRKAGFDIVYQNELEMEFRWMMMVARYI